MISLYEPDIKNSDINNVLKALKKGWVSGNTPVINDFEKKLSTYLDVKYAASEAIATLTIVFPVSNETNNR